MRDGLGVGMMKRLAFMACLSPLLVPGCGGTAGDGNDGPIPAGRIHYIKASNTGTQDEFGSSIALSADGNTLAVGAPGEDSGARGVKMPDDTDYWSSQSDNSGYNDGAVYIFARSGDTWTQQAYVKAPNSDTSDGFGHSLSLSDDGNTLAVGAINEDGNGVGGEVDNSLSSSGAVYVFNRSGDTWVPAFYVKASNPDEGDHFGCSVSVSGDGLTLAVGAKDEDGAAAGGQSDNSVESSGAVYIFVNSASFWYQEAYLKGELTDAEDHFGHSVALSGDGNALIVGVPGDDSGNVTPADNSLLDSGAFYIFNRTGANWSARAFFKPSVRLRNDQIGAFVAISSEGTIAAVGGGVNDGETVFVFTGSGVSLVESSRLIEAPNQEAYDAFGSVALSADGLELAVGAQGEDSDAVGVDGDQDDNSASESGAAYLFRNPGTGFFDFGSYIKSSNTAPGHFFGFCVALSGTGGVLAVAAKGEDSGATGVGGDGDDHSAPKSGAVYILDL